MIAMRRFFPSLLTLLLAFLIACGDKQEQKEAITPAATTSRQEVSSSGTLPGVEAGRVRRLKVNIHGNHGTVFTDSNQVQLQMARKLGIEPVTDLHSAYFTKRPLVKVESNQYYQLDTLKHSIPYLVPEAAELLNDIGKNFIDSLHSRGGDSYKIKVTSLLRTPESVGRLRRVNINATDSSTHQYATTFDISYNNFYCLDENRPVNQNDLKNLLAEVLYDLRQQGRCLVKYERKTGCFHVTVAN